MKEPCAFNLKLIYEQISLIYVKFIKFCIFLLNKFIVFILLG